MLLPLPRLQQLIPVMLCKVGPFQYCTRSMPTVTRIVPKSEYSWLQVGISCMQKTCWRKVLHSPATPCLLQGGAFCICGRCLSSCDVQYQSLWVQLQPIMQHTDVKFKVSSRTVVSVCLTTSHYQCHALGATPIASVKGTV